MTVQNGHIPSPLPLRIRRMQHQILPIVAVVFCAVLAGVLWMRQVRGAIGTGEVNAVQVQLESKVPGLLRDLPKQVELFDEVQKGDVVARIDMSIDEIELRRLEQELATLEGNPAATTRPGTTTNSTAAWYHTRIEELQARLRAQEI